MPLLLEKKSLWDLKAEVTDFCQKLFSSFQHYGSWFVSPETLKQWGAMVGAKGSSLKDDLEAICAQIDPHQVKYLIDELRMGYNEALRREWMISGRQPDHLDINPLALISNESQTLLAYVYCEDKDQAEFYREFEAVIRENGIVNFPFTAQYVYSCYFGVASFSRPKESKKR